MKTKVFFLLLIFFSPLIQFAQEDVKDEKVYITASGKKYHKSGCSYLKGGGYEKKLSEVKDSHSPCSRCFKSTTTSESKKSKSNSLKSTDSGGNNSGTYTDSKGRTIYTGPRGGKYYINKNGNKTYVK